MDTVIAAATPSGRSALAVLRLSGPEARQIAETLCPGGPAWRPRRASLRRLCHQGQLVDEVLALWMPAPRSFTGEDVVELSCHGNPLIVEAVVAAAVAAGARPARPGEFTRRALENGRVDLLEAEALAGLIHASSPEGLALSRAGMHGSVSRAVAALRERLLDLAAELEARLDHPGEDLGFEDDATVAAGLGAVAAEAAALAETWRAGRVRIEGAKVALFGPVNAGKSSLFNNLVGFERALVSPQPGTTRDVVERAVWLDGLEISFLDTAGERLDAEPLERAGLALGQRLAEEADLILVVLPLHQPLSAEGAALLARTSSRPRLVVGTHADLGEERIEIPVDHRISNLEKTSIEALRTELRARVGGAPTAGARAVLLSQRQHDLFSAVAAHARQSAAALLGLAGPAVAAEEATWALERLAELRGDDVREDVLDRLFARFCIGK